MTDGRGPFAEIKVVTAARGIRETNELLSRGWTLLSTQLVEELQQMGNATNIRLSQWIVMSTMGRQMAEGEDAVIVREEASDQGEDAVAVQSIRVELPPDGAEPQPEPEPVPVASYAQDVPPVRTGKRKIAKGEGEFEASGIRG